MPYVSVIKKLNQGPQNPIEMISELTILNAHEINIVTVSVILLPQPKADLADGNAQSSQKQS